MSGMSRRIDHEDEALVIRFDGLAALTTLTRKVRIPYTAIGSVSMGPGGWVSFKGGEKPRPRGPRRPWWAVLLRARPLGK